MSETTVWSINNDYVKGLRRKRSSEGEGDLTVLPHKKCGTLFLLGQELDVTVQTYLRKVREGGGALSSQIVMAAARRI